MTLQRDTWSPLTSVLGLLSQILPGFFFHRKLLSSFAGRNEQTESRRGAVIYTEGMGFTCLFFADPLYSRFCIDTMKVIKEER